MVIVVGEETRVNTWISGNQVPTDIAALSGGGWVVTWRSANQDGSSEGTYQQAFDTEGTPIGAETRVNTWTNGSQVSAQIATLSNGNWVVTWSSSDQDGSGWGVYQQTYQSDGTAVGGETKVNSWTQGNQQYPNVAALADGGWVISWTSDGQDGFAGGIYQQLFHADGSASGPETRVNTSTAGNQIDSQISVLSDGKWVVTWKSVVYEPDLRFYLHQQLFNDDGTAIGTETRLNTLKFGNHATVAPLSDGGWVAIWVSSAGSGAWDVYQQVYNNNGSESGAEIQVSSAGSSQAKAEIAILADGGWVVTWHGNYGESWDIHQQAYYADGTAKGPETLVNSSTSGDQWQQKIAALSDGGWVIVWESQGGTIYQQAYNADGTANGIETKVNGPYVGGQSSPEVRSLGDGGWVVVWYSSNQDGSGTGVYQRTFHLNEAPTVDAGISEQTANEDEAFSFIFGEDAFADPDAADTLTYTATLQGGDALPAWLTFDAETRTFSGTADSGDVGDLVIEVTATDNDGESVSTTFNLTVQDVNDDPELSDRTSATREHQILTIDVLSDAADEEGDTMTVTSATVLSGFGTVTIDDDGNLVYDPTTAPNQNLATGQTRDIVIRYTVSDGNGGTSTADVTVTVTGIEPDIFKGTGGNNTLTGSLHRDILYGYGGNDMLNGRTGADRMEGGTGNDTYVVDNAGDRVVEVARAGTDTVRSSISHTLSNHVENLILTGTGNLSAAGNGLANAITGNNGSNILKGSSGNDVLKGLGGNDKLYGEQGADKLQGGAGADQFIFLSQTDSTVAGGGRDTVLDFSRGQRDKINLAAIDADTKAGGNQKFEFIGDNKFHKDAGELRIQKQGGDTLLLADRNGDGKADFSILVDGHVAFKGSDFLL